MTFFSQKTDPQRQQFCYEITYGEADKETGTITKDSEIKTTIDTYLEKAYNTFDFEVSDNELVFFYIVQTILYPIYHGCYYLTGVNLHHDEMCTVPLIRSLVRFELPKVDISQLTIPDVPVPQMV